MLTRTHDIDKDFWKRQGLMVLTTPMVLTKTHGIELVLLNHTRTRGPSVTRMRDYSKLNSLVQFIKFLCRKLLLFLTSAPQNFAPPFTMFRISLFVQVPGVKIGGAG